MMINPLEAIQVTLGINKKAAILAAGGFIVLSLAISAYQIVNDDTATLWYMLFALVMLILLMMVSYGNPIYRATQRWYIVGSAFFCVGGKISGMRSVSEFHAN